MYSEQAKMLLIPSVPLVDFMHDLFLSVVTLKMLASPKWYCSVIINLTQGNLDTPVIFFDARE
jgi:hypothetical protein